jgi:hypothetical protein
VTTWEVLTVYIFFNFRAVGHKMYGVQYREKLSDIIRRAAEFCDCLQCFFILHSMGGGNAYILPVVRKDVDVNKHVKLSNITRKHNIK